MLAREVSRFPYIKDIYFEDEKGASWTLKELEKLTEELAYEPDDITVYFDGGFDKTSGRAGLGIVVYYSLGGKRHRIRKNKSLTLQTNNEAEYAALYEALKEVQELGASRNSITIRGDSSSFCISLTAAGRVMMKRKTNGWIKLKRCSNP